MKPLVSVLMTVYNREKYIAQAIESVQASTYKNWELIIVDDVSKDSSVAISKSYAAKDIRLKVYQNETNLGDYPNRNKAASYAKGTYLKYVDADDMIYPHGIEQLVFYMEQFPNAGYGLCSLAQDKFKRYPFELNGKDAYEQHYFKTAIFHKAPLSAIIRKSAFENIGGFSGKQHLGDFELWHLLSTKHPVVLMPQGIVWYREHDDQQMNDNRTNPSVPFKYKLRAIELLKDTCCPLNKKQQNKALQSVEKEICKAILSCAKHYSLTEARQLKKHTNYSWFQILTNYK